MNNRQFNRMCPWPTAVKLVLGVLLIFGISLKYNFSQTKAESTITINTRLKNKLVQKLKTNKSVGVEERLLRGDTVDQMDYNLAQLIKLKYLKSRPIDSEYLLKEEWKKDFSRGQSRYISELLEMKTSGYFIDIGAGDGESGSVTLYFERELGWNGLLIEPDPGKMASIIDKHRHADYFQVFVNDDKVAVKKPIQQKQNENIDGKKSLNEAIYFPFLSILTATGQSKVDLLVINVKGQEIGILKSIPYHLTNIEIISVEFSDGSAGDIVSLMTTKGYKAVKLMENRIINKRDLIFQRMKGR